MSEDDTEGTYIPLKCQFQLQWDGRGLDGFHSKGSGISTISVVYISNPNH